MIFEKKKFTVYIIVTFTVGWIIQIAASIFALGGNMAIFSPLLSLAMFAPLLAAVAAKADVKHIGWKPNIKGNVKYYLLSWFMPAVITVTGAVLFYIIMPNRLDTSAAYLTAQVGEATVQQLAAMGITPFVYMAIGLVQSVTYAPVINMLFAVGEEAGWRGVMYPMLKDKYGANKGRVLGGIIWGAWHWPVMVLAGYEYGLIYWGAPFVGMAMFCLCCVVMGILLDWTYEKTNSIWAPAIAHGALNAVAALPVILLNLEYADQMILGPSPMGIVAMIPMILLALLICNNTTKSK